ncbi:MAG: DUF4174 domain-containing protein [Cytophagaceae bacterium]|nr:MAG: DUF4174 domain-containing protein [Cytophagaceae bacterium]
MAVAALAAPAQTPRPTSLAQQLRASHWQKRVLLIGAPTAGQADFQAQKKLLAAAPDQLRERDFLVLELPYDQLSAADRQYWQQELKQPLTSFAVVLIGKDGGVKRTEPKPLAPADLFDTVDKMPMRRQEARRQKSK